MYNNKLHTQVILCFVKCIDRIRVVLHVWKLFGLHFGFMFVKQRTNIHDSMTPENKKTL